MRCVKPLTAWRLNGQRKLVLESHQPRGDVLQRLELRCGQCIGCRLERSRQWAVRCMHENQLHRASSFVTLTYKDECLESLSLNYRDFQLFNKRARKKLGPFRFFMAGEYGEKNWRPHFHTAMFGVHFSDRTPWRTSPAGFQLYRSKTLEALWPHGNAEIGDVTFESAAYIARYVCKKVTGDDAKEHYSRVDDRTGELVDLVPEFCNMSRRPGIGEPWFARYMSDVFPLDRCVMRGAEMRPPRYYRELLERTDPDMGEGVDYDRYLKAVALQGADAPSLESMEAVAKARLSFRGKKL